MAKINKCLSVAAVIFVISGCVPSLHPYYTDHDLVFDAALVGTWSSSDGAMQFSQIGKDKAYSMIYTDKDGKPGAFSAHLLKLDNTTFLDLAPDDQTLKAASVPDFYVGHLLPAHSLTRVDQVGPTLKLTDMNYDWMTKYLRDHPHALPHEWLGDGDDKDPVLTASTAELQKFVTAHQNDDGFFKDQSEWTRGASAATQPAQNHAGVNGN